MFQKEMRYGCFYFFMKEESKEVRKRTKAIAITSYNFLMKLLLFISKYQKGRSSFSSVAEKSAGGTGADDTGGKE